MRPEGYRGVAGVQRFAGQVRDSFAYEEGLESLGARARLMARLDHLATSAAQSPFNTLRALLVINAGLAVCFLALGLAIFADQAEFFRELMPGTWVSFAQLAFVAAIAWSIHTRSAQGTGWRRYDNFWALSAGVFAVLALDEITQATVFVGNWLNQDVGLSPRGGFRDLDAVLLTLLFIGCALVLGRRAGVLRHHPRSIALFAVAIVLGMGSQSLDAFLQSSGWEFVAEESLKMAAEPFLVAGFLVALSEVLARRRDPDR